MTHYTRSKVSTGLLGDITRAAGGDADLAARVSEANTARHAVELWTAAGLLGAAGTELCRRVAGVLGRFCAELAAAPESLPGESPPGERPPAGTPAARTPRTRTPPAIEVIMVDFTGRTLVAAFPERAA